jgi:hypothetical protein
MEIYIYKNPLFDSTGDVFSKITVPTWFEHKNMPIGVFINILCLAGKYAIK